MFAKSKFHNKPEPKGFRSFAMVHMGPYKKVKAYSEGDGIEAYSSASAYAKMKAYSEVAKQLRGPEFDPSMEMDPKALMIPGGGKSHGTIAIVDGFVPCRETLPQIKTRQTSSAPAVRHRPRSVDLAIQDAIQRERQATQQLLAERERMAEERTQRMLEEERARNNARNKAMCDLFSSMWEKQGLTPPPMSTPIVSPPGTHHSGVASHDPPESPDESPSNPRGASQP